MRVQDQFRKLHDIISRCGLPGIEVIIPYHCLTFTVCKSTYLVGGDSTACDTSTYVYPIKLQTRCDLVENTVYSAFSVAVHCNWREMSASAE